MSFETVLSTTLVAGMSTAFVVAVAASDTAAIVVACLTNLIGLTMLGVKAYLVWRGR